MQSTDGDERAGGECNDVLVDALVVAAEQAVNEADEHEQPLAALTEPLWPLIPDAVTVHGTVDLGALDPAHQDDFQGHHGLTRRCVAARRDGHRCNGVALLDALLCPMHEGRADPALGAQASKEASRKARERVDDVAALRRLGTRQLVAEALVAEAANIKAAISVLARAAAGGDRQAALALIPWLDQGLGKPTERVEVRAPSTLGDLEDMDTAQLEAMVAEGRARRLRLVEETEEREGAAG